jgi:hypothetical protein
VLLAVVKFSPILVKLMLLEGVDDADAPAGLPAAVLGLLLVALLHLSTQLTCKRLLRPPCGILCMQSSTDLALPASLPTHACPRSSMAMHLQGICNPLMMAPVV